MFKDDIFDEWLDSESKKVLEKLKNKETSLTIEDKMILTLKAQTNHFYHLDMELKKEIEDFRKEEARKWEEQNKKWEEQNKRWEEQNKRWNEQNKKWDEVNLHIQNLYQAINSQTWKMIGSIGLIVILSRVIEVFGK